MFCTTPFTAVGSMAFSPASSPARSGATKGRSGLSSPAGLRLAVWRPKRAAEAESVTDMTK